MKTRKLDKPKLNFKTNYKVIPYVRVYPNKDRPDKHTDFRVLTITAMPYVVPKNEYYQFYDIIRITIYDKTTKSIVTKTMSKPRNFSKLYKYE